jgi:predicted DNA-binding transcriptional regulator AlpA
MAMERWLSVKEMAERIGFSKSFFYTNRCLSNNGHKAASLPPMVGIGRNLRCRESQFEAWLEGKPVCGEAAAA